MPRAKTTKPRKSRSKKTAKRKTKTKKGAGRYQDIANRLTGSKLKDGEVHAPQLTKRGIKMGSYIGPGTDIAGRIRSGSKPVSKTDKTSQAHDIRYAFAGPDTKKIRAADMKMLKKLAKLTMTGEDNVVNTTIGSIPIAGKIMLEKLGLAGPNTFTDMEGTKLTDADRTLLSNKLKELEQEGYGSKKTKKRTGGTKRPQTAWMLHVKSYRSKHPELSYKQAMKQSAASYKRS